MPDPVTALRCGGAPPRTERPRRSESDITDDAFSSITFSHDGRPVPFTGPAELLATIADPRFSHLLATRPEEPEPDHFAQVAATGDVFAFEVWRSGDAVVEQFVTTAEEVVDAFRQWATGRL